MARLWLVLCLTPVSCLLHTDPDAHPWTVRPLSAGAPAPVSNIRMDPRTKRLCMDVTGSVSRIECFDDTGFRREARSNHCCQFRILMKCTATNYTVKVTGKGGESFTTWVPHPRQEGRAGTAAQDLQCHVHDVDWLTCSWAVGREAPGDVQYRLSLETLNGEQTWECPRYDADERGIHVRCHFGDVSRFPNDQYRFVVHGSSREARVLCSDRIALLANIEKFVAPNLTVTCNKSHVLLAWTTASHFHTDFRYDLEIRKGNDAPFLHQGLSENSFVLNDAGTSTVRIRALVHWQDASPWSSPLRVVCDHEARAHLHAWLTPSLIALVTLLTVGPALLLCRRYALLQKLFPPIPHLKDPIGDNFCRDAMLSWESGTAGQEECPVARVQVLGEK